PRTAGLTTLVSRFGPLVRARPHPVNSGQRLLDPVGEHRRTGLGQRGPGRDTRPRRRRDVTAGAHTT
ncbi:hypothetical protein, partial [Streptomyces shenzhenensis]|uniref:hypothetical protein n=1 Tax=Streptomyces shenzhenensis TaxID=943815 RepID=UPI001C689BEB